MVLHCPSLCLRRGSFKVGEAQLLRGLDHFVCRGLCLQEHLLPILPQGGTGNATMRPHHAAGQFLSLDEFDDEWPGDIEEICSLGGGHLHGHRCSGHSFVRSEHGGLQIGRHLDLRAIDSDFDPICSTGRSCGSSLALTGPSRRSDSPLSRSVRHGITYRCNNMDA